MVEPEKRRFVYTSIHYFSIVLLVKFVPAHL